MAAPAKNRSRAPSRVSTITRTERVVRSRSHEKAGSGGVGFFLDVPPAKTDLSKDRIKKTPEPKLRGGVVKPALPAESPAIELSTIFEKYKRTGNLPGSEHTKKPEIRFSVSAVVPPGRGRKNQVFCKMGEAGLEICGFGIILSIHNFVKNRNGYSGGDRRKENGNEKNVSAVEHQKSA